MRCTRAEMWIYGTWSVRFVGDGHITKQPILGTRHCPEEAIVQEDCEGYVVFHCETHKTGHQTKVLGPRNLTVPEIEMLRQEGKEFAEEYANIRATLIEPIHATIETETETIEEPSNE